METLELIPTETCPDCKAAIGETHKKNCAVAQCRRCHDAAEFCECPLDGKAPDTRGVTWTGFWPGEKEALEHGWFSLLVIGKGWLPCDCDCYGASPDMDRGIRFLRDGHDGREDERELTVDDVELLIEFGVPVGLSAKHLKNLNYLDLLFIADECEYCDCGECRERVAAELSGMGRKGREAYRRAVQRHRREMEGEQDAH